MGQKGVNKVILVGNIGKDPEIKTMDGGFTIANLALATSESWKDKSGQMQEKTEWHRVAVKGKLAEIVGQYLKKGSQVYFEGKLQTRKWQDQSGQDRYSTEVVVDSFDGKMQMLGGRNSDSGQQSAPQQYQQQAPQQNAPQAQNTAPQDMSDEIPF